MCRGGKNELHERGRQAITTCKKSAILLNAEFVFEI